MLSQYLTGNIACVDSVTSWEESIRLGAAPLLKNGNINESYIDDMIANVHEFGSYIVIIPGVAMPHAQNKGGVNKSGMSLLKLTEPVMYPEEKAVNLIMVLGAVDSNGHLDLISDLSTLLVDDDVLQALEQAKTETEILHVIKQAE
ncbi:PTS system mannitol-specific IIA component/PTS system ascorbate-specific IIA component [Streptohalobacillus salinus]|uniref:Ascorbate-specific PTS system EIIA component n=1 Tax=Streptohalobacillus salinus TaxID=621096 RepID=A0A2V3W2J8_9BACI|nr:PTS sugar transporter subunit IIA [Streptohalobacillus salinus]PXW86485.1 PTS system mannitol-specific IIA component/PTS system ascorbate-specific IIA component [Streptohalobacillus salinus]